MKKKSVTMQELMIEVDFLSVNGMALALKDPPEFKIGVARNYFEGKSALPAEYDWFKGVKKSKKEFLESIKEGIDQGGMQHDGDE
jgi:hypothetical protein